MEPVGGVDDNDDDSVASNDDGDGDIVDSIHCFGIFAHPAVYL